MKVDMSPRAIENRLKLVGELTKACLLIRRNSLEKKEQELPSEKAADSITVQVKKNILTYWR